MSYYENMEEDDKRYTIKSFMLRYRLADPTIPVTEEQKLMEPIFYRGLDPLLHSESTEVLKFFRAAINNEIQRRERPLKGPYLI